MTSLEAPKCALCGSREHSIYLRGKDPQNPNGVSYTAVRCEKCGLIYTDHQPTEDEAELHYNHDYYLRPYRPASRAYLLLNNFFLAERRKEVERYKIRGKILDMGCGEGSFLRELALRGWECWGVETSAYGAARAETNSRVRVVHGHLSQANFPENLFDVVTLWHVLEHVTDPLSLLREVRRILKDDGVLVISVPNIDSWQSKISGSKWFHLDLPRHLLHFTPGTLARMTGAAGFEIVNCDYHSLEYGPPGFLQSLLNLLQPIPNLLYNAVKRGQSPPVSFEGYFSAAVTMLCLPVLLLPALLLSLMESAFGHGAAVCISAIKSKNPVPGSTG